MTRPVFLRPVEIISSNKDFTLEEDGGGAVAKALTTGTYGSILTVLDEFEDLLQSGGVEADFVVSLTSDLYVSIALQDGNGGGEVFDLVWTDTDLRDMLGFTGDLTFTGAQTHTATMTPSHLWFPTYERANQSFFALEQNKIIKGINAASGQYCGYGTGTDRRRMQFEFEYEPAANVSDQYGTTQLVIDRNYDTFVYQARAASMSSSTNTSSRGCYVYPDYTDADVTDDMSTNEGIQYGLSSSPDTHTWCHFDTTSPKVPSSALPSTMMHFNLSFSLITATEPTWDV